MADLKIILDAFTQSKSLDGTIAQLEKIVSLLDKIDKNKGVLKGQTDLASVAKLTATIQNQQKAIEKLQETIKKTTKTEEQSREEKIKGSLANAKLNAELKNNIKLNEAAQGSYDQLSAKLAILNKRYHEMSEAHRENSVTGKLLVKEQAAVKAQLESLDNKVGVHTRNVGNYTESIIKASRGIAGATGLLSIFGSVLGLDTEAIMTMRDASHELIKVGKDIHHVSGLQTEGLKENAAASEEAAVANEELAATQTAAIPIIGAVIAGIVAIGAVLIRYKDQIFGVSDAEKEKMKADDGVMISDDKLREAYNKTLIEIRDLELEYRHLSGAVDDYGYAIQKVRDKSGDDLKTLEKETKAKKDDQSGWWEWLKLVSAKAVGLGEQEAQLHNENMIKIDLDYDARKKELLKKQQIEEANIKEEARKKEDALEEASLDKFIADYAKAQEIYRQNFKETTDLQKQILTFRADQEKIAADANISDAAELATKRLAIDKKLQIDLDALETAYLKKEASRQITEINLSEDNANLKAARIYEVEMKLKMSLAQLHEDSSEKEVLNIEEEAKKVIAAMDKKADDENAEAKKNAEEQRKLGEERIKETQQLRLLRAGTKDETIQAQIENERENQKKQLDDLDQALQYQLISQEDYERKREIIIREGNKKVEDLQQKQTIAMIDNAKQTVDAIAEAYNHQSELKEKKIAYDLNQTEKAIDVQRQLAERGLANTLAFEEKRKAELERAQIAEQKKQEKVKEAEAFFNAFAEYAKTDPKTAAVKAFKDVVLARLIAGRFKYGGIVEDEIYGGSINNGILHGPSHSEGGILIEAEGTEGIFSGQEMKNLGKKNFYSIKDMLRQPVNEGLFEGQTASVIALIQPEKRPREDKKLNKKLDELIETVKNKKELNINWNRLNELVEEEIENGIRKITTHRRRNKL